MKRADKTRMSKCIAVEMRYYNRPFAFTVLTMVTFMLALMAALFTWMHTYSVQDVEKEEKYLWASIALLVLFFVATIAFRILKRKEGNWASYTLTMAFTSIYYTICAIAGFFLSRSVWSYQMEQELGGASSVEYTKNVLTWSFLAPILLVVVYVALIFVVARNPYTKGDQAYVLTVLSPALIVPALIISMRTRKIESMMMVASVTTAVFIALMLCMAVRFAAKAIYYWAVTRPEEESVLQEGEETVPADGDTAVADKDKKITAKDMAEADLSEQGEEAEAEKQPEGFWSWLRGGLFSKKTKAPDVGDETTALSDEEGVPEQPKQDDRAADLDTATTEPKQDTDEQTAQHEGAVAAAVEETEMPRKTAGLWNRLFGKKDVEAQILDKEPDGKAVSEQEQQETEKPVIEEKDEKKEDVLPQTDETATPSEDEDKEQLTEQEETGSEKEDAPEQQESKTKKVKKSGKEKTESKEDKGAVDKASEEETEQGKAESETVEETADAVPEEKVPADDIPKEDEAKAADEVPEHETEQAEPKAATKKKETGKKKSTATNKADSKKKDESKTQADSTKKESATAEAQAEKTDDVKGSETASSKKETAKKSTKKTAESTQKKSGNKDAESKPEKADTEKAPAKKKSTSNAKSTGKSKSDGGGKDKGNTTQKSAKKDSGEDTDKDNTEQDMDKK